jgi:hypothetical protein
MGIQQIGAALSQTRSPTVANEVTELAGSRAPPRAPGRQRGLWSFLTWSFVIAPIVTAEAFFAKNASALNNSLDDQGNYAAVVDKGPADAAADHDSSALAGVVVDNSPEDDSDALPLKGAARIVSHSGNSSHDGSANHWVLRDADAGSSPAGDAGGGGGGGGSAGANDAPASADSVANFQDVDALPNDKQDGLIGQSPAAEETPDGPSSGAAVESSDSVGLVDILVGEGTVLPSATSEVISSDTTSVPKILSTPVNLISTATSAVSEIISPVGLDTPLNLKDVLGFDLHVNGTGELVANDLSAALDVNPSQLVADASTAIGLATEDLPQLDFGASKTLDNLLGNGLLDVGHLSDPISDLSTIFAKTGLGSDLGSDAGAALEKVSASALSISHESGSSTNLLDLGSSNDVDGLSGGKGLLDVGHLSEVIPEPSGAVPTSGLSKDLGSTAGATLEKVGGPALSISQESGANTDLSTVSIVSDAPHVGIVGEATDLTPGHSVDFPAQPVPEGDVLFSGTNYTDYHVALNTGVSSSAVNGITATTTTVTHTHDAASVSPVDSPNASHASEPAAPEHHDVSLPQVSNVVDELGVRGHSH